VKLHLLLDHDGHLPAFGVITDGKQHEIRVARQMRFTPGTMLAIDRGYTDYDWFAELTGEGVYFVTRLKDNADYAVVEERELAQRKGVLRDRADLDSADRHPADQVSAAEGNVRLVAVESGSAARSAIVCVP
jgi:hypothetical protein